MLNTTEIWGLVVHVFNISSVLLKNPIQLLLQSRFYLCAIVISIPSKQAIKLYVTKRITEIQFLKLFIMFPSDVVYIWEMKCKPTISHQCVVYYNTFNGILNAPWTPYTKSININDCDLQKMIFAETRKSWL